MKKYLNTDRKYSDYILPFLTLIAVTVLAAGGFYWIKSCNTSLIQPVAEVAGEETDPAAGRLICFAIYLILSIALVVIASVREKKKPDKMLSSWTLSVAGGTLLWVSIGESSWHFGINVLSDEGAVSFTNFPRIESIEGIWFFLIILVISFAIIKTSDFSLTAYLFTFLGNWYGHLCMIATYPVAVSMGTNLDMVTWYRITGFVNFVIFTLIGVIILIRGRKRATKYLASICLYVAIGTLLFGTILGET